MRHNHFHFSFVAAISLSAAALAQTTATVQLTSARSGATIGWTQPVDWQVSISLTQGANDGLAGFSVDLVQLFSNPSLFDIPQGDGVPGTPTDLAKFSRPQGISNPQPGSLIQSAYGGTQVGPAGARNLLQIGGMQNTFGEAGTFRDSNNNLVMGQVTSISRGLANQGTALVVAGGTFPAPPTPGVYTFSLANVRVNYLASPVSLLVDRAGLNITAPSFSFTVTADCCSPDFNGDGDNGTDADIEAFFACLAGSCCATCHPPDFNCDGDDGTDADIEAFFRIIAGGNC